MQLRDPSFEETCQTAIEKRSTGRHALFAACALCFAHWWCHVCCRWWISWIPAGPGRSSVLGTIVPRPLTIRQPTRDERQVSTKTARKMIPPASLAYTPANGPHMTSSTAAVREAPSPKTQARSNQASPCRGAARPDTQPALGRPPPWQPRRPAGSGPGISDPRALTCPLECRSTLLKTVRYSVEGGADSR